MADILILILILLAAAGAGGALTRALKAESGNFWEDFCVGAALGLGVLILAVFFLGVAGLLQRWILVSVLVLMFFAAPRRFFVNAAAIAQKIFSFFGGADLLSRVIAGLTALLFLCYLPFALTPPIHPDALVYHLAAPKIYAAAGRIVFLPDNFRASTPSGMHMLFTLGMALRGPALAQLFHLASGALCAIALYAVGGRRLSRRAGLWAAFIFSSLYTVTIIAPQALTELGCTLFALIAFHFLFLWDESRRPCHLVAGAIFAGFALTTRYQAIVWVICLSGLLLLLESSRREKPAKIAARLAIFALIALALLSPWLIRNAINTGNPVFPFLNHFFGNRYFDAEHGVIAIASNPRPVSLIGNLRHFLLFPWLATVRGFTEDTGFGPPASPVFLALLPGLLFFRPIPRFIRRALFFSLAVGVLSWSLWLVVLRFWLPVAALLCLALGHLITDASRRSKPVYIMLLLFIAAHTLFIFTSVFLGKNSLPTQIAVLSGRISKDEYLAARVPAYRVFREADKILPPDAKVLIGFNLNQGYYLDRPYIYGSLTEQGYLEWQKLRDVGELTGWLKDKGVTHIIFESYFSKPGACAVPFGEKLCAIWDEFIRNHFRPMAEVDGSTIGEIVY